MPASSPGNMGGSVREPALSVALWLSWGAVLGAVTCAVALLLQQTELQSLRREVSRLQQRSGAPSQKRGECPWQSLWEQVSKGGGETWGEGGMAEGSQGLSVCNISSRCKRQPWIRKSREQPFQEDRLLQIDTSCSKNTLQGSQCPEQGPRTGAEI